MSGSRVRLDEVFSPAGAETSGKPVNRFDKSTASSGDDSKELSTPESASDEEEKRKKHSRRISLSALRTATMFEQRDASNLNQNRPVHEWTIPRTRSGRTPRAATLFLGKDAERWQQHERERMDASGSAGLRLAWRAGVSSTIQVGSSSAFGASEYDDDDDDDDLSSSSYSSGSEEAVSTTDGGSNSGSGPSLSRRSSARRRSSSRGSRSQTNKAFPRLIQNNVAKRSDSVSIDETASPTGSTLSGESFMGGLSRPRRFSSNGPEAAFLRHETVIGIHTPRRDSLSSNASLSNNFERVALAPLSQIKMPSSGNQSSVSPKSSVIRGGSPGGGKSHRIKTVSSSDILAQAAEAAAAAVSDEHSDDRPDNKAARSLSDATDGESSYGVKIKSISEEPQQLKDDHAGGKVKEHTSVPGVARRRHSASPLCAFKLAPRRRPIRVDGTLYDRSGPFREGAVTDGLCVRFFSTEDANEATAPPTTHSRSRHAPSNLHPRATAALVEDAVADEELHPKTYLITTPDNRVSSAAKLRRWAMDGDGNFFAAMEIKSIEAKMRAADPSVAGPNGIPKALLRELRERYLDDLLDEVQKAETLNPDRSTVAQVLCTSDNKYVRLEEDYPEEAFFVIAGCDEYELEPVVSLVFCAAVRAISKFHAAGWLHGDIKLENLMFDEKGKLVVIDYENANPYRGIPGGDGRVTLVSYDWIPPEAFPGPHGRRAGPSADLWALGCNIIRAFALRDDVEDADIREALLGKGQEAFLQFRRTRLLKRRNDINGKPTRRGSDVGIPGSTTRPLPTAADVDLTCLLEDNLGEQGEDAEYANASASPPSPGPSPQRLLGRFAREAPDLLKLIIARCVSDLPEERSTEAELECLRFVEELEREEKEKGETSRLAIGKKAVMTAIELSGSSWVRPKLDEARRNLGLGPDALGPTMS